MRCLFLLTCAFFGLDAAGAPTLRVELPPEVSSPASDARVVVFLISESSGLDEKTEPIDGPFWSSEQPLFSAPAEAGAIEVGDSWAFYPGKWSSLSPGTYRAQAALIARHADSQWRRVAGNFYSDAATLTVLPDKPTSLTLKLSHATKNEERPAREGVSWFSTPSKILSAFRGQPVQLRAGVVFPVGYDPTKKYPVIYRVPGFGGNDRAAAQVARERSNAEGDALELARACFVIVLDPEGPNGHTLFADSANNGPCQRALVEELIPALEKAFPLDARPESRMLFGHSSGGWATLWLALTRPDVFGATWSLSPDPVDFRRFQNVDIYKDANFYEDTAAPSREHVSFRSFDPRTGETHDVMTIRREARQEDVLGPDNTSGQQWDSWFAAFGPRGADGKPAALLDPLTGVIDHSVAEKYRVFDIGAMVRSDPEKYLPLLRNNVRLAVGGSDNFFLNEAVELLRADVQKLEHPGRLQASDNIRIVPGYDHGTIFQSPEAKAIPGEMLKHIRDSTR